MYEAFYGLTKPPFANVPDPDFLYLSPQHQRGLSTLRYALLTRAGFCVVTGDVGAGKTTLIRSLLQDLDMDVEVGVVSNTHCDSFEEFLRWILLAFDLEYRGKEKVEMYDELITYMISRYEHGFPVTLIIDEAQHLGFDVLEQLRMLSNVNTEKGQVLQTILVGQPELWDLLRCPELSQFSQRISYDYFLGPLENADVTGEYVMHRLRHAGCDEEIFEQDTYYQIYKATGGVPRLINLVCDTALVYGFAQEKPRIDTDIIAEVLDDKEKGFSPIGKRRNLEAVGPAVLEQEEKLDRLSKQAARLKEENTQKEAGDDKRRVSTIERAGGALKKPKRRSS